MLLVESNPDTQLLISDYLEYQGISVWTASSCAEALTILACCRLGLILSEVNLPDANAYSLLKQWRSRESVHRYNPIPAIAMSALSQFEHRPLAQAAGFQAYLQKPFDFEQLWVEIEWVLSCWQSS